MPLPYGLEIMDSCLRCEPRLRSLFCDLPRPKLEALQTLGFTTACPKGTVLSAQGQSPRDVSVLCSGHVKISTATQDGRSVCLGIAEPGTVLGLSAAISGQPHEVTIEALEPCQLKVIRRDCFLGLLRNDEAARLAALRCLSNDVRKTHECVRLFGLSHSAAEKLARVLVRWCLREDDKPRARICLKLPMTHRELAQMLGVTRETVTKLLRSFERKKLIQRDGPNVTIQDEHGLHVLSAR
jgi:CRP/FNR family cyclic AMP-dependent transcriptional regulator